MKLVRHNPVSLLEQIQNDMREFNTMFSGRYGSNSSQTDIETYSWKPAVDIKDEKNHILLKADVPGVDPKNIEIEMHEGNLIIKGHKESESEEDGENYYRVERSSGTFYRRFALPDNIDESKISATTRKGVLEITIPKQERAQPRTIEVRDED